LNNNIVIARIPKSKSCSTLICLGKYQGRRQVSVRVWYAGAEKPSQQGVNLNIEQLDELIKGLQKAGAEAVKLGWLGGKAAV